MVTSPERVDLRSNIANSQENKYAENFQLLVYHSLGSRNSRKMCEHGNVEAPPKKLPWIRQCYEPVFYWTLAYSCFNTRFCKGPRSHSLQDTGDSWSFGQTALISVKKTRVCKRCSRVKTLYMDATRGSRHSGTVLIWHFLCCVLSTFRVYFCVRSRMRVRLNSAQDQDRQS